MQGSNDLTLQLPPELLLRVYHFNALPPINLHSCRVKQCIHGIIPKPLRDVLNASQVCRRWRTLVLAEPRLWRHLISPHHPRREWVELLLERSRPLSITYAQLLLRNHFFQPVELSHAREALGASRLLSYQIHLTRPWRDGVWPNAPNSWPQLEFLCVDLRDVKSLSPEVLLQGHQERMLSEHFPGSATPILKGLHLHNCFVKNISQILALGDTLTSLRVETPPLALMPSVKGWLDVLMHLSQIKNLVLVKAIRQPSNSQTSPEVYLSSPLTVQLNEFQLDDSLPACNQLLSRLTFAGSCAVLSLRVRLAPFPDVGAVRLLCSLLSPIVAKASHRANLQSCAVRLCAYEVTCVDLASRYQLQEPSSIQDPLFNEGSVSVIHIGLSFLVNRIGNDPDMEISQLLHELFQSFHCKTAVITMPGADITEGSMSRILLKWGRRAQSLDCLTIPAWNTLIQLMTSSATVNAFRNDKMTENILLPNLQQLRFDRRMELSTYACSVLHNDLVWLCGYRKLSGCPIQTIWHVPMKAGASGGGKTTSLTDLASELKGLGVHLVR